MLGARRVLLDYKDGWSSCGYGDDRRRLSVDLVGITEDALGIGYV